jgi:hypothetical protein
LLGRPEEKISKLWLIWLKILVYKLKVQIGHVQISYVLFADHYP